MFYVKPHNWYALSSGMLEKSAWIGWDGYLKSSSENVALPQTKYIPMIQARRMSHACRLACEVTLNLLADSTENIDAAVFISQHGELGRSTKIIQSIVEGQAVSPTDFSMSVHNTASGLSTILSKNTMEISSISAGSDGFQQGLFEVQAFFSQGAEKVILVEFDDRVPNLYQTGGRFEIAPYACGFVFSPEKEYQYELYSPPRPLSQQPEVPQSLQFLKNTLEEQRSFFIDGLTCNWSWTKH